MKGGKKGEEVGKIIRAIKVRQYGISQHTASRGQPLPPSPSPFSFCLSDG